MRPVFYVLTVIGVMSLAVWAYQQNYATQAVLKEIDGLHRSIGIERERLAILRAEGAYLNRPDRLRDLANMNYDNLGLLELSHESFGQVDQIAFPARPAPLMPARPGAEVGQ